MACSWALFWNHHLDLVGQDKLEEKNRKNWRSQTVRGRHRNRHRRQRDRGRQRQKESETERDTNGYKETKPEIERESARGGKRNAETAKDTETETASRRERRKTE